MRDILSYKKQARLMKRSATTYSRNIQIEKIFRAL